MSENKSASAAETSAPFDKSASRRLEVAWPEADLQDPSVLRHAFSMFPSGLVAVCAMVGDVPVGMVAASFTSVSLNPPLVSVCIDKTSQTWTQLANSERVGLSVLGAGQEIHVKKLAARGGDRFADLDWVSTPQDAVLVRGGTLWLDCVPHERFEAGDHIIALFEIVQLWVDESEMPLVFQHSRFGSLQAAPIGADK